MNISEYIAAAIGKAEGFGKPGAIPTVTNNPGDLKVGDVGLGTTESGITKFPDLATGKNALFNQVYLMLSGKSKVYSPNDTLAQVGQKYAGGDTNWGKNVADTLGVSPNTKLNQIGDLLGTNQPSDSSTPAATPKTPANTSTDSPWLVRGSMIGLGFLMIGAGVLSFKTTQVVIQQAGKIAATTAEAGV